MRCPDWRPDRELFRRILSTTGMLMLCLAAAPAQAADNDRYQYDPARYPDWSGPMRWTQVRGGNRYDQNKPAGRGQSFHTC